MKKKIAYSLGAIATALSYQAFSTYFIFFYVDVMKLSTLLAAIGVAIYGFWNAINDPLAGYISDRTRTRCGRRIPYIATLCIPFGIVFALVWMPPVTSATMLWLFIYFLIIINLHDTLYTIVILNWASLYPEMFPKVEERAEVNAFRQSFGMFGNMIGIALPPLIYSTLGWKTMGIIFGTVIALAYLTTLTGSFEKKEFSLDKPLGIREALRATFKNRSFLTFVSANLFVSFTYTVVLASIPFFAKYVLRVGARETSLILFTAFAVAIPMMFLWRFMAVKFGAKRSFMTAILLFGLFAAPLLIVKGLLSTLIISGLMGSALAGLILIVDILIADIIDEDEIRTGVRREGMYFGVNAFITRFAIAMEAISMGIIFNLTKYNPYLTVQPEPVMVGLRILIAGLPLLAMLLAFGLMIFYPLSGIKLSEMRAQLAKLHQEKLSKI